ncbi:hypothetical protein ABH931_000260 [Streptacidiphilus sp. MAP12-33]|uniref:SsgA family sporulation/cell division regulator n=1 Tax=Streptacidiphilus sp. MAP12-33 TaxID=3156266 RepID=UPI003514ECF8
MTPPQASAPQPSDEATGVGSGSQGQDSGAAVRVACGAEIELALVTGPTSEVPFPARLTYTQADPYAVRLHCQTGPRTTVTWVLSRETLSQGLEGPSGLGDVHVCPVPGPGRSTVLITLGTGVDAALLRGDSGVIRRFLTLSAAVVPPGEEDRHLDLDALIAHLRQAP